MPYAILVAKFVLILTPKLPSLEAPLNYRSYRKSTFPFQTTL